MNDPYLLQFLKRISPERDPTIDGLGGGSAEPSGPPGGGLLGLHVPVREAELEAEGTLGMRARGILLRLFDIAAPIL